MGSTRRLTVAQAVVAFMRAQQVERDGERGRFISGVFGIFGHGNVAGLGEALEAEAAAHPVDALRYLQARNEQGMVHAAAAYTKQLPSQRTRCEMATSIPFDPQVRPVYAHLEPVVDLLLQHGNELALPYRWGDNRTGYFCHLAKPIDFALIECDLALPSHVRLSREEDSVECDVTWASIRGSMKQR